jgi:hypothetical protein
VIEGQLDGVFTVENGGLNLNGKFIPQRKLNALGYYLQQEPNYNPTTQICGDWQLIGNVVTKPVYEFAIGIFHDWKGREFVDGQLYRQIRVRVKRVDTYQGGVLEVMADRLLKSSAPTFETDADGNPQGNGEFLEVYLIEISESDLPNIQAYVDATNGAVLENYNELS